MDNDTIVAVSTPPGEGGIGIVRISGEQSLQLALQIFVSARQKKGKNGPDNFNPEARKLYYGYVVDEQGSEIDEVLLSYMPGPYSYTCEDIVEINAHGGMVPLRKIVELIIKKGARPAEPGEFTRRAFLNGRIDLVQAESILSIIRAKTEKGLQAALKNVKGFFSEEIAAIRAELVAIMAEIDAQIDFPEEDLLLDDRQYELLAGRLAVLQEKLQRFEKKRRQSRILQEGLKTVIAGKPNVGKSSLYNYLLGEERAIVTEVPGTTRDLLMEFVNIKGVPLKIIDTAGLRTESDSVEKIGIKISQKAIAEADLLLFVIDASTGITAEDRWVFEQLQRDGGCSIIIIANKIDLGQKLTSAKIEKEFKCGSVVETSILTGAGLVELEDKVEEIVFAGEASAEEGAIMLEARHEQLLEKAITYLEDASRSLQGKIPLDIISIDLRMAQRHLAELVGEEVGEEVLDYIFSRFCIGK